MSAFAYPNTVQNLFAVPATVACTPCTILLIGLVGMDFRPANYRPLTALCRALKQSPNLPVKRL